MDAIFERLRGARGPSGTLSPAALGIVRSLSVAVGLQWAGAGALLPLLPLYVRDHGGSDLLVGAVMAAYFAGAFVCQYLAGRVSDRLGRLPVLVGGLVVYALGSVLFLVPAPAVFDVGFRALQGAGAGAALVAAFAAISTSVPLSHRGRAAGRLYGAELGGLAVGPVLGSFAGVGAMRWLFVAAAAAALVAIGPVWAAWVRFSPDAVALREQQGGPPPAEKGPRPAVLASMEASPEVLVRSGPAVIGPRTAHRAIVGALLAGAMIGVTSGVYESCWSLLMTRHGAAQWQIGISWTLFALPFALMSRPAGWLADHFDRRWLAIASLLWSAAFCATYPFLPGFVLLMVLGVWESLGFSIALPACQSLLGQASAPERHGHAQGTFAASQTAATALAAACAGALYGVAQWLPFVSAAVCCLGIVVAVLGYWRGVPGRMKSGTARVPALPAGGGAS